MGIAQVAHEEAKSAEKNPEKIGYRSLVTKLIIYQASKYAT